MDIERTIDMADYSVAAAKNGLPDLINRAQGGEHVVITRRGKPVAELRPVVEAAVEAASDDGDVGPKTRAEWNEWMHKRRRARPGMSITSVELLSHKSDETPW